jgi:DNA invertase Pin-like site-specific DNA recombinase
MPEQRRRFSPQFKAEAVQMVIETGKPVAEVARGLGIHDGTLGNPSDQSPMNVQRPQDDDGHSYGAPVLVCSWDCPARTFARLWVS